MIPDRVKILGTVRCLDSHVHKNIPSWIEDLSNSIAKTFGGEVKVQYRCIAPPVKNDSKLNQLIEQSAIEFLGKENVKRLEKPSLGAEDFAVFLEDVPGAMFRLGVAGHNGCAPLHNGEFSLDEQSLEVGVEILSRTIFNWMDLNSL